jgi:hypothetical protein
MMVIILQRSDVGNYGDLLEKRVCSDEVVANFCSKKVKKGSLGV